LDSPSNGKFLVETAEDFALVSEAYPTHYGSHPKYDGTVKETIEDIILNSRINMYNISELDDNTITKLIEEIEDACLDILEDWQPSKLN